MIISVAILCFTSLTRRKSPNRSIFYWFASYYNTIKTTALPYDGWRIHPTPALPRSISGCAVGHDPSNHTIWFLDDDLKTMTFDYLNNQFIDNPVSLPRSVHGYSQNYAQIGTTLYMLDAYGDSYAINSFNMQTLAMVFVNQWPDFPVYISPPLPFEADESCLVAIRNEYLAVLGRDTKVQILNIESQTWLNEVPPLQISRETASCIYLNDKIFIIGGWVVHPYGPALPIEYLDVSPESMMTIASISWEYNRDSLPHTIVESRCVTVNDDILVIGGWDSFDDFDTVYVINSINGSVSLGGHLAKAVIRSNVIVVNNIIYSFGGAGTLPGWQSTLLIPTSSPTTEPSYSPSSRPPTTILPTSIPTTISPTTIPNTISPTSDPTINPTTAFPSINPTINPTINPSINPTTNNPMITSSQITNQTITVETRIQTTNASYYTPESTIVNEENDANTTFFNQTAAVETKTESTNALYHTTKSTLQDVNEKSDNNSNIWFILSICFILILVGVIINYIYKWINSNRKKDIDKDEDNSAVVDNQERSDDKEMPPLPGYDMNAVLDDLPKIVEPGSINQPKQVPFDIDDDKLPSYMISYNVRSTLNPVENANEAVTIEGEPDTRKGINELREGQNDIVIKAPMDMKRNVSGDSDDMYIKKDDNDPNEPEMLDVKRIQTTKGNSAQSNQDKDTRDDADIYYDQHLDKVFEEERNNDYK